MLTLCYFSLLKYLWQKYYLHGQPLHHVGVRSLQRLEHKQAVVGQLLQLLPQPPVAATVPLGRFPQGLDGSGASTWAESLLLVEREIFLSQLLLTIRYSLSM